MSQAPLLAPVQEADPRVPFTRWRCLWNPYLAIDSKVCEPFAKLVVVVDKAVGLSSPDFNGLADPYVTLCLNGEENVRRTKAQKQTLKPVWDETFVLDIFHPISIITATVYDQEYGDSDFADLLSLGDVLAGWVDIRVGAMPLNEWVCGWFPLGDPKHYKDTITGRVEDPHPEGNSGVGSIHLKMFLSTTHPRDELFAMCLPLPDLGHSCHLDLADLIHDVVSLSKAMDKWNVEIWADIEWVLHHSTPVYFAANIMIWYPGTIIPTLAILVPLILIYLSVMFSDDTREVPHGLGGGLRRAKEDAGAEAQVLLHGSGGQADETKLKGPAPKAPKAAPKLTEEQKKKEEAKKQAEETEQMLRKLVHLMPKHAAKELRKTAADMENLVEFVDLVENLAKFREGYGTELLLVAAMASCIPLASLLLYFSDWQVLILQITLTIVVSVNLWPYSFPGRMATGFFYFFLTHWRLRAKATHSKEDDHKSVEVRTLARPHVKHLGLLGKGKLHEDHIDLHGHSFDLMTFDKPKYCDDCGAFLWGVKEQGFHCRTCQRIVCHDCAHTDGDGVECPGACKVHEFEVHTVHHATWCAKCEGFLWGMHEQGMKCKHCCTVYCKQCAEPTAV